MITVRKVFEKFDPIFNFLSAFILGAMVLSIFAQVVMRWFGKPLAWSVELSQYLFVWLTFIAGYAGARKNQHIGVELIQNKMPAPVKKCMVFLSWFLGSFYYGLVFFYCAKLWPKLMVQTSPMMKIPMAFIYLGMMIGVFMMSIYYFFYAIETFTSSKEVTNK